MVDEEGIRTGYRGWWSPDSIPGRNADREFDAWLREHDAQLLEAYADEGERFMIGAGEQKPADDEWNIAPRWHEIRRLRERAAQIRAKE